ncbi:MAG: asparagine synthase (glutamine-hydrolyzing) [Pyrinomonadaceae bacterium]
MCGIAGTISFESVAPEERNLERMNDRMRERGPDGSGTWISNGFGLAHTRLSIVDLSAAGKQPMEDRENGLVITFNGEIYNFKKLREELESKGHSFRTATDTEVLLKGYVEWGTDRLLGKLEGMFAFCLLDQKQNAVFLCRDHFGKRPLYYSIDSKRLVFSSDIRVVADNTPDRTLDLETVDFYLSELASPQPKTIWKEIKQVPPASFISVNLENGRDEISKYWELRYQPDETLAYPEILSETKNQLREAVRRRIHGDVPIGTFLSGGIDSGLVTAFLATLSEEPVRSFTVGFDKESYDESDAARAVAERYGTNHHQLKLQAHNVRETIEGLIEYIGEPFADSSIIPTYLITKEISRHVKVALSGDGGDETFGGYYEYKTAYDADDLALKYPSNIGRAGRVAVSKALSRFSSSVNNLGNGNTYLNLPGHEKLYRKMAFEFDERDSNFAPDFVAAQGGFAKRKLEEIWRDSDNKAVLPTLFLASFKNRLLNDYLVKVDRASMRNSLEVRCPFLDHKLVEWAMRIPASVRLEGGITKRITKDIAREMLGEEAVSRPKWGFGIPILDWLNNDLRELIFDYLSPNDAFVRQFFRDGYVDELIAPFENAKGTDSGRVWSLLCLEIWARRFV